MRHGPVLAAASTLVDLLVRSTELTLRDRLVLETGLAAASCDAGALWRRSPDAEWHPSVERGRRGGRFEAERATRRALESPLAPTLAGHAIVRSEIGGRGVALVLAGSIDDEASDALEALLTCMSVVELAGGGAAAEPEAPLPAPSPARDGESSRIQHDVRNALTSLMATRQVLERYGSDLEQSERQAFVDAVDRECERTGSILAQGITGRASARSASSTSAEIVADVLALERAGLERAGCTLSLKIAEEALHARPACGPDAWSRIVRNLVANAREAAVASASGRAIAVSVDLVDDGVRLRIDDASGGLPRVALPTLFQSGFSAGKADGTGQGLAVVRELCVSAGGALVVERRDGGACFEIWMPSPRDVVPNSNESHEGTNAYEKNSS